MSDKPTSLERYMVQCPSVKSREEMMELVAKAQNIFVTGKTPTPEAVAEQVPGLTVDVCRKMITTLGWRDQRRDYLEDTKTSADIEHAEFIRNVRTATAKNILDSLSPALKSLGTEIQSALDSGDSGTVRRLAESLTHVANPILQAAAVEGKMPEITKKEVSEEAARGKVPWLNINASGPVTLAGGEQEKKPIDVDVD